MISVERFDLEVEAELWEWILRFESDGDGRTEGGMARRDGEDLMRAGVLTREGVLDLGVFDILQLHVQPRGSRAKRVKDELHVARLSVISKSGTTSSCEWRLSYGEVLDKIQYSNNIIE